MLLGIIGGAPSSQSAVVCISADTLPVCSGTLVGAHTVLTAGHCANLLGESVSYFVNVGPDCHAPLHRVRTAQMVTHPRYTGEGKPFDLAMVLLSAPLDAGTLALADGLSDGGVVRHVGYGTSQESPMSGWGLQRAVSHAITRIDDDFIWSGDASANTCN